jgi:hypothetical protein
MMNRDNLRKLCSRIYTERVEASFGDAKKWANLLKSAEETTHARKVVFSTCVKHARLDLIEQICEHGWHKRDAGVFYDIMLHAAECSQLTVLHWLDMHKSDFITDEEELQFYLNLAIDSATTNDDVAIFKYFWDKILSRDQVNEIEWKRHMCINAVVEWAPHILEEFFFDTLGRDVVFEEIRSVLDADFRNADEARAFLNKHEKGVASELKCAMQLLDEMSDIIPEGNYVKISNHLMNAYNSIL